MKEEADKVSLVERSCCTVALVSGSIPPSLVKFNSQALQVLSELLFFFWVNLLENLSGSHFFVYDIEPVWMKKAGVPM
jgi:hypothetical protein